MISFDLGVAVAVLTRIAHGRLSGPLAPTNSVAAVYMGLCLAARLARSQLPVKYIVHNIGNNVKHADKGR